MDNHTYFVYRMDAAADKALALDTIKGKSSTPLTTAPLPLGCTPLWTSSCSWANYSTGGHVQLADTFDEVSRRLSMEIYAMHVTVAGSEITWPACCVTCPERHPDDELPDEPDDEGDGGCDEDEELFLTLQELYGPHPNPAHTGTRRPYPDYEHWYAWGAEEWVHFQGYKRKVLAASTCDFSTMRLAVDTLAAIKANMGALPLERQVEIALWASDIADHLTTGIKDGLFEICRFSLYTQAGRDVQKHLFPDTIGEPGNYSD